MITDEENMNQKMSTNDEVLLNFQREAFLRDLKDGDKRCVKFFVSHIIEFLGYSYGEKFNEKNFKSEFFMDYFLIEPECHTLEKAYRERDFIVAFFKCFPYVLTNSERFPRLLNKYFRTFFNIVKYLDAKASQAIKTDFNNFIVSVEKNDRSFFYFLNTLFSIKFDPKKVREFEVFTLLFKEVFIDLLIENLSKSYERVLITLKTIKHLLFLLQRVDVDSDIINYQFCLELFQILFEKKNLNLLLELGLEGPTEELCAHSFLIFNILIGLSASSDDLLHKLVELIEVNYKKLCDFVLNHTDTYTYTEEKSNCFRFLIHYFQYKEEMNEDSEKLLSFLLKQFVQFRTNSFLHLTVKQFICDIVEKCQNWYEILNRVTFFDILHQALVERTDNPSYYGFFIEIAEMLNEKLAHEAQSPEHWTEDYENIVRPRIETYKRPYGCG